MPNLSDWGQFGIMKVRCIIPVIRILTFNIGFFRIKNVNMSNALFSIDISEIPAMPHRKRRGTFTTGYHSKLGDVKNTTLRIVC